VVAVMRRHVLRVEGLEVESPYLRWSRAVSRWLSRWRAEIVYDCVLPAWDPERQTYVDPETGVPLPSWDEAVDQLDQPAHVARFGVQVDARGVLAGSADANRAMGYLAKYLTKSIADCHQPETDRQRAHVARLLDVLRWEPCSERCANWLRYGVQPRGARDGLRPGSCRGKAHRAEHLGYAGRRVLVSRKWSGKTLGDHRADRRDWVLNLLGNTTEPADPNRYAWEPVRTGDPDVRPLPRRLLLAIAERQRWRQALDEAKRRAGLPDFAFPAA
jgi:hypothetical protein